MSELTQGHLPGSSPLIKEEITDTEVLRESLDIVDLGEEGRIVMVEETVERIKREGGLLYHFLWITFLYFSRMLAMLQS